jgi:Fic family protein
VPGLPTYADADDKRRLEIRNGAIQFLAVLDYIERWKPEKLNLDHAILCELHRLAINQIYSCAGTLRDGPVKMSDDKHEPPDHTKVPELVREMCEYVTSNWDRPALHLASYLMWRLNWIHPFFGGNGRTARAVSYLIMCARLGFVLPGAKTIPDLIVENREPYYDALHRADESWSSGSLDVSQMESLMSSLLAAQLIEIHNQAAGRDSAEGA